jgi:vancomycin resistance protein YoaR
MRTTTYPTRQAVRQQSSLVEEVLLSLLAGLIFFFLALGVLTIGNQVWYAGRIFPGVSVGGVDVGGLSQADAAVKIAQSISYPQNGHILIREQQSYLVTPGQMGLFLDPDTSARQAFQVGRSDGLVRSLGAQFNTWYNGESLPPVMLFDQRMAYQYLADLAKQIDKPTIEASVDLKGVEVQVHSGQTGRSVDIPATLVLLSAQIQSMQDGIVPVVVRETPPVIIDVSQQADLARSILSAPLKLTLPDGQPDKAGPWTFDPPTLAAMLVFEKIEKDGKSDLQVTLNSDILREYLNNLVPKLVLNTENARFTFNDQTHQLEVIQPSVTGRQLDVEATIHAIQDSLVQGKHKVALKFIFHDPPVSEKATGQQLGITELVHAETSYFYGSSAERVQNIKSAAERFHGLLVAPGEVFSMGGALGDISLDNGYAEALIIVGNRTVQGIGGGVCQVSTTLFRTVFFTGYPILERHSHAYRVSYYEKIAGNRINPDFAGLDATVYFPLVDLKFKNDTPYWLLMETYVNPSTSSITWKFYSTSDGRTVKWETTGPVNIVPAPDPLYKENPDLSQGEIKQVDWAADGADVTVNRTVNRNGDVYLQDTFQTHYEAWQAIYEYGPGTDIPTPEPK